MKNVLYTILTKKDSKIFTILYDDEIQELKIKDFQTGKFLKLKNKNNDSISIINVFDENDIDSCFCHKYFIENCINELMNRFKKIALLLTKNGFYMDA